MTDTDTTSERPAPEIGNPIPADCLFCGATITVTLGPSGPMSMILHPTGDRPAIDGDELGPDGVRCPGTNLPPLTGNEHIDSFRKDALYRSIAHQHAADALRDNVVEMFADKRSTYLALDELANMVHAETLATRWRELARDEGMVDAVYDAVADLAAPPATAVNDAWLDRHTRIGVRTWLREAVEPIPGSMLAGLVDKL